VEKLVKDINASPLSDEELRKAKDLRAEFEEKRVARMNRPIEDE
jgi:hypothetical protein